MPDANGLTTRVGKYTEITKAIIEVMAILVGGWWAYRNFGLETQPGLSSRLMTKASLELIGETPDALFLRALITIRNNGKIPTGLLCSWYNIGGYKVVRTQYYQRGKPEYDDSSYSWLLKAKMQYEDSLLTNRTDMLSMARYFEELKGVKVIQSGRIFDDRVYNMWLEPDDEVIHDFIVYVPKDRFDIVHMKVFNLKFDWDKREQIKEVVKVEWKIMNLGILDPNLMIGNDTLDLSGTHKEFVDEYGLAYDGDTTDLALLGTENNEKMRMAK